MFQKWKEFVENDEFKVLAREVVKNLWVERFNGATKQAFNKWKLWSEIKEKQIKDSQLRCVIDIMKIKKTNEKESKRKAFDQMKKVVRTDKIFKRLLKKANEGHKIRLKSVFEKFKKP